MISWKNVSAAFHKYGHESWARDRVHVTIPNPIGPDCHLRASRGPGSYDKELDSGFRRNDIYMSCIGNVMSGVPTREAIRNRTSKIEYLDL